MAQVSCSNGFSSTEETSKMAADQALLKNSNANIFGDIESMRCEKCKSKKKKVTVVCIDCGELALCNDCNRKVHENNKVQHQLHELRPKTQTLAKEKQINGTLNGSINGTIHHKKNNSIAKLDIVHNDKPKSLLLIDSTERLQVTKEVDFKHLLGCDDDPRVKVVSIFGNTGDGKSHTLNHTFFDGAEVFDTSPSQKSCTVGVWVSYCPNQKAIIVDTEGLLGVSENANKRMRLLMKILAVSDVVIYRTRAERLHSDMFTFLGDASEAYIKYFTKDLQSVQQRGHMENVPLCSLGPSIVIFQETHYTTPLGFENDPSEHDNSPEEILRSNFFNIGRNPAAFSSINYVGTRTTTQSTDFSILLNEVKKNLKNKTVRSARPVSVIFNALMFLNDKFGDDINDILPNSFPDEYFTCVSKCLSCSARCGKNMNHEKEEKEHRSEQKCTYQAQFDNKVYTCKACHEKGVESLVIPKTAETQDSPLVGLAKYAWSGYVLECPKCGVIYRSRQFWYGNGEVENFVRIEIKHVWPGTRLPNTSQNSARRILDGMMNLADAITNVSAKPTKAVTSWVTDKVAPTYWTPNYLIIDCAKCGHDFEETEKKHHCRACGRGYCDSCTQHRIPVPDRGWGDTPVRVCDDCFTKSGQVDQSSVQKNSIDISELLEAIDDDPEIDTGEMVAIKTAKNIPTRHPPEVLTTRKVTEQVQSTLSFLSSSLEYPLEYLVDSARPDYWVPDSKILNCHSCEMEFSKKDSKHHCRKCGKGFCDPCSKSRVPVPSRGWDYPVRVCNGCSLKKGPL